MKRFAFTLLELVFVIIVIGILAVLAMPNFSTNPLQQAAEQVAGHIRYTQHLAMMEDKFDPTDPTWYASLWRIRFYESGTPDNYYYTVFSDLDKGSDADYGAGKRELAIDPLTKINMHDASNNHNMDLTGSFGISSVSSTCDNGWIELFFDNLGRPYIDSITTGANPPYSGLLQNDCNITLVHQTDGNATITIAPETGYVSVSYN
ncbi:MAG: prepilin-type N-terminal cleavage/methylation domain-containing protein [Sulfuricurvum sp.]|uniref:pilus assembly FimT family protein n=1 Tax=Sulfuricurvum sp. TaxID=2025608 RepID=UPI002716E337|nr:prepilin-type N-terminal cleavage/methylation domain-containing protein [Sulfuricurvum sp.]MDO9057271.1 prepilin-type N-terminal cleavage/methylation domain-containing protein [Sulfuricurvum sp.]